MSTKRTREEDSDTEEEEPQTKCSRSSEEEAESEEEEEEPTEIRRTPFERLIQALVDQEKQRSDAFRQIVRDIASVAGVEIEDKAIDILRSVAEDYLVRIFTEAAKEAELKKRVTVESSDFWHGKCTVDEAVLCNRSDADPEGIDGDEEDPGSPDQPGS
jgi:histone H3/H4